jgi:transposase
VKKRTVATNTLLARGAIAGPLFVLWYSSLRPGQVMDNLPIPRCEEAGELIEARGCELLFAAPCSPNYINPIEEAFSKIKALLRKVKARTREALIGVL